MNNEPEWVDDAPDAEPPRPPDERAQLIESIRSANILLSSTIQLVRMNLLRLDEIGSAVTRARSRADKMEEVRDDWWRHFDYDVVQGNRAGTKDQQVRAERYELS